MLNLWRRHLKSCPHRVRTYKKCGCPIWVQGTLHGKWLKQSLDLRNWESAQALVRDWESGHARAAEHSSMTKACDAFIRDGEARNLSSASLGKYRLLTEELKTKFKERSVGSLTVDEVRRYRESWELAPISARKKLERLRTFFRFCIDNQWMHEILHAHPLNEHFPLGLVLLFKDALCGRLFEDRLLLYLPASPVVELAVVEDDRGAVLAMRPPPAAQSLRPEVSNEKGEAVDQTEFRGDGKVRLECLPRAR